MCDKAFSHALSISRIFFCAIMIIVATILAATGVAAQTPSGADHGGGLDSINYYNGHHSFKLPLLQIGGRGGAQMPLLMQIDQHFKVGDAVDTNGLDHYYPDPSWVQGYKMTYEPGYMLAHSIGVPDPNGPCDLGNDLTGAWFNWQTLTRLSFTGADGTEHEFVDQQTMGQVITAGYCPYGASGAPSRGKVFVSVDGSGATFIADNTIYDNIYAYYDNSGNGGGNANGISGTMFLKDGTVYRFGDWGSVTWIRDRNGNQINFAYETVHETTTYGYDIYVNRVIGITDSLNREINIAYDVNDGAPYGLCDRITYKGFGGAARAIRVSKTLLENALRTTQVSDPTTPQSWATLFPYLTYTSGIPTFNPTVRSAVWLPNGQHYQLYYNAYGELARVEYPTGGATEYDTYDVGALLSSPPNYIYRRVNEERSYVDGNTLTSRTTLGIEESNNPIISSTATVDHWDPAGNRLAREKHYYYYHATASFGNWETSGNVYPDHDENWKDGREYQTESFDTDGSTVLQRTTDTWQQGATFSWAPTCCPDESPQYNPRVIEHDVTLVPTNRVSKTVYTYDQYNNVTSTAEYDFGTGSPGALLRSSQTTYVTTNSVNGISYDTILPNTTSPSTTSTVHIRNLPSQTSVFDASGTECARTTYEYDNYAASSNHAALVYRSNITGLDSNFTTSKTTRGNVTSASRYLLPAGTAIMGYSQYDIAGNVVKTIDPLGKSATLTYTDNFGSPNASVSNDTTVPTELGTKSTFAFVTQTTNALGHSSQAQFDFYRGISVDIQDSNGIVMSSYFDDPMDRPTQVISNASNIGSTGKNQTTTVYDDVNRSVTTTTDLTTFNDNALKSQTFYDGFGRTTETHNYETSSTYITGTAMYDALGRSKRVYNPSRNTIDETNGYTEVTYDALSRATAIQNIDKYGHSMGTAQIAYSGLQVLATDQAGHQRMTQTNGLGQIQNVWEITAADSATESISFPGHSEVTAGYKTSAQYNTLGAVTQVTQQIGTSGTTQTRSVVYDSLGRRTSATNPESGTVSFTYDDNGNFLTVTDARAITTTFTYDDGNRIKTASYSDGTPTITYTYDNDSLPFTPSGYSRGAAISELVAVTRTVNSVLEGNVYGFDSLGRAKQFFQRTDGVDYGSTLTYNAIGIPTGGTYPSGRTVTTTSDSAGRLASLSSAGTNGTVSTGSISYSPAGRLTSETYGNGLVHSIYYNSKHQPIEIQLGTSASLASVIDLQYNYGTTTNTGKLLSETIGIGTTTFNQTFTYDSLDRLTGAQENPNGGATSWSQSFSYDRFGNRTVQSSTAALLTFNPTPTIDQTTNRFASGGSFVYDAAGNLTQEPTVSGSLTSRFYVYDADGHIIQAKQGTSQSTATTVGTYVYDVEGRRVKKITADNILMVYDIRGVLVAEYDLNTSALKKEYVYGPDGLLATVEPTNGISYVTADHLGSPSVISDNSGVVISRHDYAPFGEEIPLTVGGRSTSQGYSVQDRLRQKFTGYERDIETGLDFAEARYYSSIHGRFSSADTVSGSFLVPQSLNLYAYVGNNPLNATDPTGHYSENPYDEGYGQDQGKKNEIEIHPPIEIDMLDLNDRSKDTIVGYIEVRPGDNEQLSIDNTPLPGLPLTPLEGGRLEAGPSSGGTLTLPGNTALPSFNKNSAEHGGFGSDLANFLGGNSLHQWNEAALHAQPALRLVSALPVIGVAPALASSVLSFGNGDIKGGLWDLTAAIPFAAEMIGGFREASLVAREGEMATEGIYEFVSKTGEIYVGQSGSISARIGRHLGPGGKLARAGLGTLKTTEVLGGKTAREVAEQLRIIELGGIEKLANVRNPIGAARGYLLPAAAKVFLGY